MLYPKSFLDSARQCAHQIKYIYTQSSPLLSYEMADVDARCHVVINCIVNTAYKSLLHAHTHITWAWTRKFPVCQVLIFELQETCRLQKLRKEQQEDVVVYILVLPSQSIPAYSPPNL